MAFLGIPLFRNASLIISLPPGKVFFKGDAVLCPKKVEGYFALRIRGSDSSIERNKGYHGCAGQSGTTIMPFAFSAFTFCRTLLIKINGNA